MRIYIINQIYSLLFLRCMIVAAPIQVQFTSNSSPIGSWKSIVFTLYLRSLCSNSALFLNKQKVKRFALHLLFFTNCLICLDVSRKKSNFALIKSETCVSLYWATSPIYSQSSSNYASPACEDALHVANKSLRQKDTGLRADTHIL